MTLAKINFSVALAAIFNPAWLRFFAEISPALAFVLQVLGITLALLQILKLVSDWNKRS